MPQCLLGSVMPVYMLMAAVMLMKAFFVTSKRLNGIFKFNIIRSIHHVERQMILAACWHFHQAHLFTKLSKL